MNAIVQRACLSVAMLALCAGCATQRPGVKTTGSVVRLDDTHFLVLGIGLITVDTTRTPVAAQVIRGQVLGLQLSSQPGLTFAVGWADGQTVLVPAENAEDVRLEARRENGALRVKVDRAQTKTPSSP